MDEKLNETAVANLFRDGMTIMIGGFGGRGVPHKLIAALIASGARGLTVITNDTGDAAGGMVDLLAVGRVATLVCSYVGQNRRAERLVHSIALQLVPQGVLAERIRAGGAGIEGVVMRLGKRTTYQRRMRADVALIRAHIADARRNLAYRGADLNFNHVMATAADVTIVQAETITSAVLGPDRIRTPGVYVDHVF